MTPAARRLLAGDGLHAFGSWIDHLAILTLAAWRFQASPLEMALVAVAGLLPGIVFGPALGRRVDRGDARRWLLASLGARLLATAALLGGVAGGLGWSAFLALIALRSLAAGVAPPAIQVLAVRTVAEAERTRFFALLNLVNNTAKVAAPLLGALTGSLAGETTALALSALCSALAATVFWPLPPSPGAAPATRAAVSAPAPAMAPLLWTGAAWAFAVFLVSAQLPLVLQRAAQDPALLGLLVSCSGAGNVLAGLWLARRPPAWTGRHREAALPVAAQAAGFAAMAAVLAAGPVALALPLVFFATGLATARFLIALNVRLAKGHAEAMGQASARLQSAQNAAMLAAPLAGAALLAAHGGAALFAAGAVVMALAALPWPTRPGGR